MKKIIIAITCLVAMAVALAGQDLKITYNNVMKLGRSRKSTITVYYTTQFWRTIDEEKDTLIDFGTFTSYEIDHKNKTIVRLELDDMIQLMDLFAAVAEEAKKEGKEINEAGNKLLKLSGGESISVKKIGTEVVLGRTCEKWDVSLGKLKYVASVDPTLVRPMPPYDIERARPLLEGLSWQVQAMALGESLKKFREGVGQITGVHLNSEVKLPLARL